MTTLRTPGDLERASERVREAAGLRREQVRSALTIARAVLGPAGVVIAPHLRAAAMLRWPDGQAQIHYRASLTTVERDQRIIFVDHSKRRYVSIDQPNIPGYSIDSMNQRLRTCREQAGLSARELSKLAGLAPSHVGLLEASKTSNLNSATLLQLCQVLGCTAGWLVNGEGKAPSTAAVKRAVLLAMGAAE